MKISQINEGIRKGTNTTFFFDVNNDQQGDYVNLTNIVNVSQKQTKWYRLNIYYSFKINKGVNESDALELAGHLKDNKNPSDTNQFIDLAVEHFVMNYSNIDDIDLITYPESSSIFNKILGDKLSGMLGCPVAPSGFTKKQLQDTGITDQGKSDMRNFKRPQYAAKSDPLKAIRQYLYNPGFRNGKHIGQHPRIVNPIGANAEERSARGEKGRFGIRPKNGKPGEPRDPKVAPLVKLLIALDKLFKETENDSSRLQELIDKTAEYWAEREAFKMNRRIDSLVGDNTKRQKLRATKTKKIRAKDKREFLDYLNISPELSASLPQYTNILVVDDRVDYGGTFSRINQIIGGGKIPGLTVHYYSPLAMKG